MQTSTKIEHEILLDANNPTESTLQKSALVAAAATPKATTIVYWIVTALFCLQMGFTVYAQLRLPQVAEMFAHLGFPAWFRVELSWAKLLGIMLLLAPAPARLKEWAYAGFAITLASALIAHLSVRDGPEAWSWAAATGVLWALSYFFWRRMPRRDFHPIKLHGIRDNTAAPAGHSADLKPSVFFQF